MGNTIMEAAKSIEPELVRHRRWLHQHPGVGFETEQTLEYVLQELQKLGLQPIRCGKGGLMAEITGKPGKTILLRADMDALPIREESGVDFAADNGNMHACGHDLHTAMLLGAAKLLVQNRQLLRGTVRLMFQSAEEIFAGAKEMIDAGILQGVSAAVMIHVTAAMPIPSGTVIVSAPGVTAPAADYFTVSVKGKGCHGSAPQDGVDALTAAVHSLIALQELSARELRADSGAVLTIGKFSGGTAGNAIADQARMEGTIRTYDEETRAFLKRRLKEICGGIAAAFRAETEVRFGTGCPTLKNDPQLCESLYRYLQELLGNGVLNAAQFGAGRGGGSEDFAYVSQQVPSVMLALAAGEPSKGYAYPQHHPKVLFDETVLPIGAAVFTQAAISYLTEA